MKDFGRTPPCHKVVVVAGEITYVPDRETFPLYWKKRDLEEQEANRLKCSYKGKSRVLNEMKKREAFITLDQIKTISIERKHIELLEELFQYDSSELLVLSTSLNISSYCLSQLAIAYPQIKEGILAGNEKYCLQRCGDSTGSFLVRIIPKNEAPYYILFWEDFEELLSNKSIDIPQHILL